MPLPSGGLDPGASVSVAFTFQYDTRGTFWFGYDADATTVTAPQARRAAARNTSTQTDGCSSLRRTTTRNSSPTDAGRLR